LLFSIIFDSNKQWTSYYDNTTSLLVWHKTTLVIRLTLWRYYCIPHTYCIRYTIRNTASVLWAYVLRSIDIDRGACAHNYCPVNQISRSIDHETSSVAYLNIPQQFQGYRQQGRPGWIDMIERYQFTLWMVRTIKISTTTAMAIAMAILIRLIKNGN